jgi:hypothetical protein
VGEAEGLKWGAKSAFAGGEHFDGCGFRFELKKILEEFRYKIIGKVRLQIAQPLIELFSQTFTTFSSAVFCTSSTPF